MVTRFKMGYLYRSGVWVDFDWISSVTLIILGLMVNVIIGAGGSYMVTVL